MFESVMIQVPCPLKCGEWSVPKNPQFEEPEWKVSVYAEDALGCNSSYEEVVDEKWRARAWAC